MSWTIMLIAYESKLIYYYDLSAYTWLVIILFEIIFIFGCILGVGITPVKIKNYDDYRAEYFINGKNVLEKKLKRMILILSAIAAIAIVTGFISMLQYYDTNIFGAIDMQNRIYNERLDGTNKFLKIPYLSSFLYLALILTGIYIKRFYMKLFLTIPIILVIFSSIMTGNRYNLIIAIALIIFPILFNNDKSRKFGFKNKLKKKNKLLIFCGIGALLVLFWSITSVRSSWIITGSHMSPLMIKLCTHNPAIYKIYSYLASPPGVLNAFLEDPYFQFGKTSFAFVYNIMENIGILTSNERVAMNYYVPIASNTGSYIKDLISDFSLLGGLFVTLIFGYILSSLYKVYFKRKNFVSEIYLDIFSALLILCFFTWYLCETLFWIMLVFAYPVGKYLDGIKIHIKAGVDKKITPRRC
jgi:oligosaccharide repeat unit polymerase